MQTRRKTYSGDAFERALKGAFGGQASLAKIENARLLYARYRTHDLLERLKGVAEDRNNESKKL